MSVTRDAILWSAGTGDDNLLSDPNTHLTGSAAGDNPVDVSQYEGDLLAVVGIKVASGTIAVKAQTCATEGGSYTDVAGTEVTGLTGGSFALAIAIPKDRCKQFVQLYFTASGESKSAYAGAVLLGIPKYKA